MDLVPPTNLDGWVFVAVFAIQALHAIATAYLAQKATCNARQIEQLHETLSAGENAQTTSEQC